MSQADFEIANQGFPSFRSDLNSNLQALASNSAGATEPSATFAYQFWYDETTDLLKLRNSDDDAWITLAAFDQTNDEWEIRSAVIQAVDSAGVVIKTDDGTTRIEVQDDGDVSINSGQLFVDQSTGRIGIGTTSPDELLELSANTGATVKISSTDTTLSSDEIVGAVEFETSDASNSGVAAKIEAVAENASGEIGLSFSTGAGGSAAEAVRIDRDKNLKFNSGYGSVATAYGCRAWVNFNESGTIRGSGNVSSVSDTGTGLYEVNFSTSMPDVNYTYSVMSEGGTTTNIVGGINAGGGSTVNKISVVTRRVDTNALLDVSFNSVAIFR